MTTAAESLRVRVLTLFFALLSAANFSLAAPIAYASSYDGATSSLYRVDFGAGTASLVGGIGFAGVSGLAFQPGTGALFGVDHATGSLIRIDTGTGAGTLVGSLGAGNALDVGLEFDSAGGLYMSSDGSSQANLFAVDPTTGTATLIGTTGTTGVVGLAFSAAGVLYGLVDTPGNELVTLDVNTGTATAIGALGFSTNTGGIGFADGTLWGAFGFVNRGLTTIDPTTGAAAAPTDLGIDFAGLAIQPTAVSEPATILLLGLSLFAAASGRRSTIRP